MPEGINFRCLENPQIRKSENTGERKMTFVASDATRDSAGTVLNQNNWNLERFNNNGVIGYQHKVYGGWDDTDNPDNIIGKGRAYIEEDENGEKRLMVDVEFEPEGMNELADKVYKKLEFGTLKAVSVGFRPLGKGSFGKGEEAIGGTRETYYFAGQELLEVSVVNIPANPNALKRGVEEAQKELEQYRKEATPQEPAKPQEEPKDDADALAKAIEQKTIMARAALL